MGSERTSVHRHRQQVIPAQVHSPVLSSHARRALRNRPPTQPRGAGAVVSVMRMTSAEGAPASP
eukprot:4240745-Prymnesium_polylepis.2